MTKASTAHLDHLNKQIGARMKAYRREKRMSQTVLAEAIGVSFQQLQKYERGVNRVSAARLYLVARILERDMLDFFDQEEAAALEPIWIEIE